LKKVFIIGGAVIIVLIAIVIIISLVFKSPKKTETPKTSYPSENLTLTYWRIFDEKEALEPIIETYQKQHKNVTIKLVDKDSAEYETELINALAGGTGPDIFMIHSDWLPKHQDKLAPMPEDYLSVDEYQKTFAPVAAQDLISDNRIWGIPFYIDTLALYYNNALVRKYNSSLNYQQLSRVIDNPPQNWNEFIDQTKKLTKKNGSYIIQAGAALGTANNVETAADILALFMLQNNTKMVSEDQKTPTFNLPITKDTGQSVYPGTSALEFYTSFARPNKETYSWNAKMPDSTTVFIQGKTAMMINYAYKMPTIQNQAPDLDFKVVKLPQVKGVEKRTDFASYWPEVVAKNSKYPQVAWDFLKFATDDVWQMQYCQVTKRISSKISSNSGLYVNQEYRAFGQQVKTATSWYKDKTPDKIDQIFKDMISSVVNNNQPAQKAIDAAAESIKTLWRSGTNNK